jgi:hypothetical protein
VTAGIPAPTMPFPDLALTPVLAYGDGDFNGYWLLALLLITFINWVATQLKQRRALKRGEPFEVDPEDFAPYRDRADREADAVRQAPVSKSDNATDEIRDFFAALTGQPASAPPPVPARRPKPAPQADAPPPVPVPVPVKTVEPAANAYLRRVAAKKDSAADEREKIAVSEAEKEAAARYQRQFGSTDKARQSRSTRRHDSLMNLLKTPGSLRTAFVLREVLGPPKSLQNEGDDPTL